MPFRAAHTHSAYMWQHPLELGNGRLIATLSSPWSLHPFTYDVKDEDNVCPSLMMVLPAIAIYVQSIWWSPW